MHLSVVIITYNEEKNIARCLGSVQAVADDIVVVDSFSSDGTEHIVKECGARFVQHSFDGHIEQKNWAITQAKHPWILSLDADEALDDDLVKSILDARSNEGIDGFTMNRLTRYCGHWVRHGGWYPDVKLRLWDSRKGKWAGENPHDRYELEPSTNTAHLKGNILHYSFDTKEQHTAQITYFTDIASKALYERGKRVNPLRPALAAFAKFLRDYFFRAGFLDGATGFTVAWKSAGASFDKYAKLRKLYREA